MLTTANLGLKKPAGTEPADIAIPNENMDILDVAVASKAPIASPTFTGIVALPSTTSIGTVTDTELSYLDGVTSPIQTQINAKQATITGAATTIDTEDLTASRVLVSDASGKVAVSLVTSTELGYVDGVTSSIQTQLNAKALASDLTSHQADYVRQPGYATATGTANTYAVTLSPALSSYVDGVAVSVKINVANTGASTINVNGLGAKSILKANGNALASGNLKANSIYTLRYNGTSFILQGEGGEYGTAGAGDVLAPLTIGTESGLVTGTMVDRGTINYTPSNVDQTIAGGKHSGAGKVLAVAGVRPGTGILLDSGDNVKVGQETIYTKKKELQIKGIGTYRVTFQLMSSSGVRTVYGMIYRNGVPVGIERSSNSTNYVSFSEDVFFNDGDLLQIYYKTSAVGNGYVNFLTLGIEMPVKTPGYE